MSLTQIEIHRKRGDQWEVSLPARDQRVLCQSFQEAARRGYELAAMEVECEIVVHDAYHRVIRRQHLAHPVHEQAE